MACTGMTRGDAACVAAGTRNAADDTHPPPRATLAHPTGRAQWPGFAGLRQTTVERLMRESEETADARASARLPAAMLSTARHVHGGSCAAVRDARASADEARSAVRGMCTAVATAGGRASTLMEQLTAADAYLSAGPRARELLPSGEWDAFHRVVGADIANPDWPVSGTGDASEESTARKELAKRLAGMVSAVGLAVDNMRCAWQHAAAKEVEWRERQEAGRSVLRVCMRAWHEVAEGIPAGRAAWEQRKERARAGRKARERAEACGSMHERAGACCGAR